jgi:hypothetical protein
VELGSIDLNWCLASGSESGALKLTGVNPSIVLRAIVSLFLLMVTQYAFHLWSPLLKVSYLVGKIAPLRIPFSRGLHRGCFLHCGLIKFMVLEGLALYLVEVLHERESACEL